MKLMKPLAAVGAAAALVGTIALAYAQTTQEPPATPAGTTSGTGTAVSPPADSTRPSGTSPMPSDSTSASPATSSDASPSSAAPSGDASTMSGTTEMREPKPDRN